MHCSCCRQLQLQPAQQEVSASQPDLSSALQLDLTQQPDSSQPVSEPTAALQEWFAKGTQFFGTPTLHEADHSITEPKPASVALFPGQSALTDTQPNGRDLTPRHSQSLPSSTYKEQPQHSKGSHSTGSYIHPHQMQHRGLSGFLTPLGKLAGMFGWTPGKPNEPLDRSQALPATAMLDHEHHGRKELVDLARPANLSSVSQELPARLLRVRPEQLTLQQLQNLQKAAELLSPRHASPIRSSAHSLSAAIISLGCQAKAPVSSADQSLLQQPTCPGMSTMQGNLDSSSPAHASGCDLGSSSGTVDPAVKAACDVDVVTQDDDDIVAALASKLAMMAPHVSSLYADMLRDTNATYSGENEGGDDANQGHQSNLKRKRREEPQNHQEGLGRADHAQHTETMAASVSSLAVFQQVSQDACNQLPRMGNGSGARHLARSLGQDTQNVLQQRSLQLPIYARKRFRKTTGLEVLHRCMPSLWQQTGQ